MQIIKGTKFKLKNCGPNIDGHIIQSTDGEDTFKWVTSNDPYRIGKRCMVEIRGNDEYLIPLLTIKEL